MRPETTRVLVTRRYRLPLQYAVCWPIVSYAFPLLPEMGSRKYDLYTPVCRNRIWL
uniref:Uncharacterized protein n=1 Tax=Anguilla anguilla TaxID=7936 RepID=A0A0E9QSW1_ANGAN